METKKDVVLAQPKKARNKKPLAGATAIALGLVSSASNAALDVAPLTTEISGNSVSMETVMLAVLSLIALFVGYRMIKRSMS